jgi:ribosome-associated protein
MAVETSSPEDNSPRPESISMPEHLSEANDEAMRLDHFLQTRGLFESGGQAKHGIQASEVKVNGQIETRRRRKLMPKDVVEFAGKKYIV